MAKAGRPKAEVTKDKVVCVRMKPEEYRRLKEYAEASKLTISQVMQRGVDAVLEKEKH